ncbi:ABC transporter ATP-binding protein [Acidocella aminolytica]|jgi:branched-chain amino acid transport system ATP-binding protein|uniref:ABC transporter n=2 Tax=Acidocella TaxID=50709 RepID=A0A0D6PIT9_9PROT|nr:ABC transporter ATP-binding protein [Acidocella aminolytica]GAN81597.1 ABC transporter [Acidocella aminolytica 101 = DSM 11237]GBQ40788.1 branched-chain amino acid ABC transporter ATP-binding protein [Acidocella aminolytica 101 = DSM 11237]SHF26707.1 amino acid/amide ABC transporter ATP-binding protein 2, HAAT family (TC 3.A.1.4.-) [Acidocella aminolytica 101 = DSM 11237]
MSRLILKDVESGYGPMQILWGIDLTVNESETVILLGANSAGKTTLLRTIIGLLPCTGGSILFEGEPIHNLPPDQRIRRGIAYMSELGVFPGLTIEENIRLGGYFLSGAEVRRRSTRLYELFPALANKRREQAASLSGGQRKMLGIAKVLVSEPKLLLMDEPSSGLAPVFVKQVVDVLKYAITGGMTLLIAEQNIAFLSLADRGYLLEGGQVKHSGTRAELESSDVVREAYFGL